MKFWSRFFKSEITKELRAEADAACEANRVEREIRYDSEVAYIIACAYNSAKSGNYNTIYRNRGHVPFFLPLLVNKLHKHGLNAKVIDIDDRDVIQVSW